MNQGLINNKIQASVQQTLDLSGIERVMKGEFFTGIAQTPISAAGWKFFVMQKYASVVSFLDFLMRGVELSLAHSQEIAHVFEDNYKDEIGYFAGKVRPEYAHEEWRQRSLKRFGITAADLKAVPRTPALETYQNLVMSLIGTDDFFEIVGALLFWEPFVVEEMRALIKAFERDLPDLFPQGGYDDTNFPHNEQEYWYSHAEHDVWHFKQIRESLQTYLMTHPITEQQLVSLKRGMGKVQDAKSVFYSSDLLEKMKAL